MHPITNTCPKVKRTIYFMYFTFFWKIVICERLLLDTTRINKKIYEDSVAVYHIFLIKLITNRLIYARILISLIYNIWLSLVFGNLYFCCSSNEINRTTIDGLTYLGRKNINRTKPASIEINTLEKRKNTTYFNITEQRTDNEQTNGNEVLFVWSPMIVGAVVTPVTLCILYELFRFCKLTKNFSQNLRVEDEEQRNFLQ